MSEIVDDEAGRLAQAAQDAAARRDWHGAEASWRRCIAQSGKASKAAWHLGFATALQHLERYEEADAAYAHVRKRWPNNPRGWMGAAHAAAAREDWAAAETLWKSCIARFADAAAANWWVSLSHALQQQGRSAEARDACRTAQQRFPNESAGWVGEAKIASARHAWRHAAKAWEIAAEKSEAAAQSKHLQSAFQAHLRSARFADAARVIGELKRRDAGGNHWLSAGLELLGAQGDWRGAVDYLTEHVAQPQFHQTFTAAQLAKTVFEAGLSPVEALDLLAQWIPRDEAVRAIEETAWKGGGSFEQVMDVVDSIKDPERPANLRQKRLEPRRLLRKFLQSRRCPEFSHLTTKAFAVASDDQIRSLYAIAMRLFPKSRVRFELEVFLAPGSVAADDVAFASGWRKTLPQPAESIAGQLKGLPHRRLRCVVVVRDEAEMLPHLIDHYMRIGVRDFLIIDNGSVDDLGGIRNGVPGADIVVIDAPYDFTRNRCGATWINEIHEAGICDWLLLVDADERLVFPGCETAGIDELLDHFDRRGETAMPAFMLDMYDENYCAGAKPCDDIKRHHLFLANYSVRRNLAAPHLAVSGGIRATEYLPLFLTKTPLVRSDAGVRMRNIHMISACVPSETTGILLHYKIFRDRALFDSTAESVAAHPRVRDRTELEIGKHIEFVGRAREKRPAQPFHLVYSGTRQLVSLGYLSADEEWRARVPSRLPRNRRDRVSLSLHPIGAASDRMLFEQPGYRELLGKVVKEARAGRRDSLRSLLNQNVPRIEAREIRLGILLLAACMLGRERTSNRIAEALVRLARAGISPESRSQLGPVLMPIALSDKKSVCVRVLDALAETGTLNGELASAHAFVLAFLGRKSDANAALARAKLDLEDWTGTFKLMFFQAMRDWPAYYEALAQVLKEDLGHAPSLLPAIHACPDPEIRDTFLNRLRQRLEPQIDELIPGNAWALLSALHGLKLTGPLREAYGRVRDRLPRPARLFFGRMLGDDPAWSDPGRGAIWCLSLSKMGTTSLHAYMARCGLFGTHFQNFVTGELLNGSDARHFDFACDSSLLFHAVRDGVDPDRRIMVATRDFASWEQSCLVHFARELREPVQVYEKIQETFYATRNHPFGEPWVDIHHDLYFRHASFRMAYECHRDWIATLGRRMNVPVLELPLEAHDKAERVSRFLGGQFPVLEYPHSNPRADPNEAYGLRLEQA